MSLNIHCASCVFNPGLSFADKALPGAAVEKRNPDRQLPACWHVVVLSPTTRTGNITQAPHNSTCLGTNNSGKRKTFSRMLAQTDP